MRWKLNRGATIPASAFGNPVGGTSVVRLCLYDASAEAQPLLVASVPPGGLCNGKQCWKALANGGYRYRNRTGTPEGVTGLRLRRTALGAAELRVKGKGLHVALPPLDLSLPVTAQLLIGDGTAEECWEAIFPRASRNDAVQFRARIP